MCGSVLLSAVGSISITSVQWRGAHCSLLTPQCSNKTCLPAPAPAWWPGASVQCLETGDRHTGHRSQLSWSVNLAETGWGKEWVSVLKRVLTSSDVSDLCLVADWPGAVLPLLVTGHTCSALSSGPTLCVWWSLWGWQWHYQVNTVGQRPQECRQCQWQCYTVNVASSKDD